MFAAHLMLAVAFGLIHVFLQSLALATIFDSSLMEVLKTNFFIKMAMRITVYTLIVVGCSVFITYQRRREEESKARTLETRVAIAQFQVLKSKLNPEFLFHTLRGISGLMHRNIESADRLTARLGDFLRLTLETSSARNVPLHEEIELVKSFIEIRRFDHPGLRMIFDVDPHSLGALIPNRVLLDVIQRSEPSDLIHLSALPENNHLTLSLSGLRDKTISTPDSDTPYSWMADKEQIKLKLPLQLTEHSDEHDDADLYQSLDEFQRSIAQKEDMVRKSKPSRMRRFWGTILVWTAAGLLFSSTDVLTRLAGGQPVDLLLALRSSLLWYLWALFTPLIFAMVRLFPLRTGTLQKNILIHSIFSFLVGFIMALLYYGQMKVFPVEGWEASLREIIVQYPYVLDALTYWGILGAHEALAQRWAYIQQDVRSAKLKRNLMEANLEALKMQLHPHFLFNTLNSIAELMHEDLKVAEEMLKRLETFLRLTFEKSDVHEITLQNELDYLRNYLDIQQVRFQNRLQVALKIDPLAMEDRVPNLILQPIVENAILHGVSPRIDAGRVEIRAFHHNGNLLLEVEDDGPGLRSDSFREGVGMSNTRMRLQQIYGKDCSFKVRNNPRGGLVVRLQIPSTEIRHERTN